MYKISYKGDGVTNEFIFAFPFFQPDDVRVAVDGALLDTSKYQVIANEELTGGTVILYFAPETDCNIDIYRQVALARVIDYQPTAKIDPEHLNADFNFLLAALQDINAIDINLSEWANTHDTILRFLEYTNGVITDKLSGGGVLGLYNNLVSVLSAALPKLINDYGSITEPADVYDGDDYGVL